MNTVYAGNLAGNRRNKAAKPLQIKDLGIVWLTKQWPISVGSVEQGLALHRIKNRQPSFFW